MGKLIVLEGIDGSGKSTQFKMLCEKLEERGAEFKKLVFPQYSEPSSALIKMYLGGEFGTDPGDVNAYAASAFYAVDRFASYAKGWKDYYAGDGLLLCDRYTTSNAIHQASKVPEAKRGKFFKWLYDFEFGLMELPKPDAVIYLDMPVDISQKLMTGRYGGNESKKDVHEADVAFLEKCRKSALYAASRQGWHIVECSNGKEPYSIEKIHNEIMKIVDEELC